MVNFIDDERDNAHLRRVHVGNFHYVPHVYGQVAPCCGLVETNSHALFLLEPIQALQQPNGHLGWEIVAW